ncbi:MAG: hypothetical protein HUU47_06885 [Bacteroidetes bacterium]|nr:hypothetical protein [Bacteroidota bacterium]
MKYFNLIISCFILINLLSSCNQNENNVQIPKVTIGLKPIYFDSSNIDKIIYSTTPKTLISPGKIFKYGSLLLVSDSNIGIHIIDNADKTNPTKISFINIPGNIDLALKGNYLYADCNGNLITIDISDPSNAKVTSITPSNKYSNRPTDEMARKYFAQESRVFYECVDEKNGTVLMWEKDTLYKPECYLAYRSFFEE